MKTIYKYPVEIAEYVKIDLPKGAEILTVQEQRNQPMMWALVDPNAEPETRLFGTFGTGHPLGNAIGVTTKYIGTYQSAEGQLVLHVFEYLNL
jgi:hypothetical protein